MRVLNDALMMHHFKLCMQNYAPLCTIPQLLVHWCKIVQNNAIGFFLMPTRAFFLDIDFYQINTWHFILQNICSFTAPYTLGGHFLLNV